MTTQREPKSKPLDDADAVPDVIGGGVPGQDGLPAPVDAMAVGFDPRFIRAVAVALMRVALDGPPDIGPAGEQMCRYIVGNPEEQARRFAVALASDPEVVAAALATNNNPGEVAGGLSVLTERVRRMWSVMAGQTGNLGVESPATGAGSAPGKG